MRGLVELVHRLTLSLWTGAAAYLAFIATPALFAHLTRDEAGRAVSVLFPSYITAGYAAAGILFVTALILSRRRRGQRYCDGLARFRVLITGAILILALYGGLVLYPQIEDLRLRIPSLDPGATSPEREAFDRLHGLTFGLNLLALLLAGLLLLAQTVRDVSRGLDD